MNAITPAEYVAKVELTTAGMAESTIAGLHKAYAHWRAGDITTDGLREALAMVLLIANAYARTAGDLMAAAGTGLLAGVSEPRPLGQAPHVDPDTEVNRLSAAAATLIAALDEPDADLSGQLQRIGQAEPAQALREQMRVTYAGRGVTGWYRGLNAGACELCQSWAGGGTFPTTVEMLHHPGCGCVPIPTTTKEDA